MLTELKLIFVALSVPVTKYVLKKSFLLAFEAVAEKALRENHKPVRQLTDDFPRMRRVEG
jgi:hypothetical protein